MTGRVAYLLDLLGFLCLAGQGVLLFHSDSSPLASGLSHPGAFLLLTLVLVFWASWHRNRTDRKYISRLAQGVLILSLATLFGVSLEAFSQGRVFGSAGPDPIQREVWEQVSRGVDQWRKLDSELPDLMAGIVNSLPDSTRSVHGGDLFRILALSAEKRAPHFGKNSFLGLEMVLWGDGQRLAWTRGAEPLAAVLSADDPDRLVRGRENWCRQLVVPLATRGWLEFQIPLIDEGSLSWRVSPLSELGDDPDADAASPFQVVYQDRDHGLALSLLGGTTATTENRDLKFRSRIMLAAWTAWFLALLVLAHLCFGVPGLVGAGWLGRLAMAGAGYFQWWAGAFPWTDQPAGPGRLTSLLDPAYFGTPLAGGLFSSTADSLFTAILLMMTIWSLLRWRGLVGWSDRSEGAPLGFLSPGRGLFWGALFGVAGFLILGTTRFLADMVATNANPRLIGQNIPLGFLPFWFLHLVLMLLALSLFSILVVIWGGRSWPRRGGFGAWQLAGALSGLTAWGGSFLWPGMGAGNRLLMAGLVWLLWWLVPAAAVRPRFLGRYVWPAILLLAAIWNYQSLNEVYQGAEREWMAAKAEQLVEPANLTAPYLLKEALEEMRQEDGWNEGALNDSQDVWRDDAAYQLWRASSLRDLGFPLLVEIIGEDDQEESLFTTGFMGDFNYEVGRRTPVRGSEFNAGEDLPDLAMEKEQRFYPDGEELVLSGWTDRQGGGGQIRVEIPIRSWRLSTQLAGLSRKGESSSGGYRPRPEVERPILLLRGDDQGWLDVGALGIPGPASRRVLADLKRGERDLGVITLGEDKFLCTWKAMPLGLAHFRGEGYLLGLQQPRWTDQLLDLSRLILLNLIFLALLVLLVQTWRGLSTWLTNSPRRSLAMIWPTGFQERFLAGYLFFGLLLLLVVGTSVDRAGYKRVRAEARALTRSGLDTAVQQLRSLLVEQARSLSESDYINDLLVGQLSGSRPAASPQTRQAMVFSGDGGLLLDETLSDLTDDQARVLLAAGRTSPMLMMMEDDRLFVGTVIPIDLSGVLAATDSTSENSGRSNNGFFLYRQRLDRSLLGGLADLVQGQATVRWAGRPLLASHPADIFSGREPLLMDPGMMATLLEHAQAAGVFAASGRPFAFTGAQPIPSFSRSPRGGFGLQKIPAVLELAFPDREKEYGEQRLQTVLFLAGLANVILLTALLLAVLMSWNLFRPLRLLLTATRSLAKGDFDAPLPEGGRDEVGRLAGAFGAMRSELSSARDELASRERFLALVLNRVTVGVAVVNQAAEVVSLNPAGRQILTDFYPGSEPEEGVLILLEQVRLLAGSRLRWGGEIRSGDGLRTLRAALGPLDLPEERTDTMLVFEDITEFLQTRKMAINAELARQVAHEIKNPLTPIQLSVQLLNQAWRDHHPQLDRIVPETVQRVLDQVDLLRSIATEFSLLGRPGDLEREAVDLLAMVKSTIQKYDGAVVVDLQETELPLVLAEVDSLAKILGNLMQNSLDAVEDGGQARLDLGWKVDGRTVTLLWADNGTGLAAEVAERLFDPYFSTKSKGTGLGLAISRNLADRMGGSIILRNRPEGRGALAELTLPRQDASHREGHES